MKFGVMIFQGDFTYPQIKELWLTSERLGFDSVWVYDHFSQLGECLEGWTLISSLAPLSKNIRFGLLVACNSDRHPPLLAKMASTLDIISNGRLEFGIGAGDAPKEYESYGYPFPRASTRIEQLDEALTIIKKMWTEVGPTYKGKYYSIKEVRSGPRPIQKPHPPIWIGSLSGKRLISTVAAKHADVYNIRAFNFNDYIRKMVILQNSCERVGRHYKEVEKTIHVDFVIASNRSSLENKLTQYAKFKGWSLDESKKRIVYGTPDACTEMVKEYRKLGVQYVILCFQPNKRIEDLQLFSEVIQHLA